MDRFLQVLNDSATAFQQVDVEEEAPFDPLDALLSRALLTPSALPLSAVTGRVGPPTLSPSHQASHGTLEVIGDSIKSTHGFSSTRFDVCVYKGRWIYEIVLETAGVMQLGWSVMDCPYNDEDGVGDFPNTVGFDGRRVKAWLSGNPRPYGVPWSRGDVIGCELNLDDDGSMVFWRNGVSMGVVNGPMLRHGPGAPAYFPAFSLSKGQSISVNFGQHPFKYSYEAAPLHQHDGLVTVDEDLPADPIQASVNVMRLIVKLAPVLASTPFEPESDKELAKELRPHIQAAASALSEDDIFIVGARLIDSVLPLVLLSESVCTHALVPALLGVSPVLAARVIQLFATCVDDKQMERLSQWILIELSRQHRAARWSDKSSVSCVATATSLLRLCPGLMDTFEPPVSRRILEGLMTRNVPTTADLAVDLPRVWFGVNDASTDMALGQHAWEQLCRGIAAVARAKEDAQLEFCIAVNGGEESAIEGRGPLIDWMVQLIEENASAASMNPLPGLTSAEVLMSVHNVALQIAHRWKSDVHVEESCIHDLPLADSRLGGSLSHLRAEHHPSLQHPEPSTHPPSVTLFHLAAQLAPLSLHQQLSACAARQSARSRVVIALASTVKARTDQLRSDGLTGDALQQRVTEETEGFRAELVVLIRACAYDEFVVFPLRLKETLFAFVDYATRFLSKFEASDSFDLIPSTYLDGVLTVFHALRTDFGRRGPNSVSWVTDPSRLDVTSMLVSFIERHFDDQRIKSPGHRQALLHTLESCLQYPVLVRVIEQLDTTDLVPHMLQSYGDRSWVPLTQLILRLYGYDFAETDQEVKTACSSALLRQQFKSLDSQSAKEFVNSVFNHLNWSLTEWGVITREITSEDKPSRSVLSLLRSFCVTFQVSVELLHLLAFLSRDSPKLFLDSEINSARLSEMLLSVIAIGTEPAHFSALHRFPQRPPLPRKIHRGTLLAPVVSILYHLSDVFLTAMANDAAFVSKAVELFGEIDWASEEENGAEVPPRDHIVPSVAATMLALNAAKETQTGAQCSICCDRREDCQFHPCGHRTCHLCIERQLLNSTKCFFCQQTVDKVMRD